MLWSRVVSCLKQIYDYRFNIKYYFNHFCDYIFYNFFKKEHLLDLRQPWSNDTLDCYRYGDCAINHKMIFAIFNLLNKFVEKEIYDFKFGDSSNYINQENMKIFLEIKKIHYYWNVERKEHYKIIMELENNYKPNLLKILEEDLIFKNKEDEMIQRLLNIRNELWV